MLSPVLFAAVPFKNPTAFSDLVGTLELMLRNYADEVYALSGISVGVPPLGNNPGSKAWLLCLQRAYDELGEALGIGHGGDISSFDLKSDREWPGWTFSISQETERLRAAAGIL